MLAGPLKAHPLKAHPMTGLVWPVTAEGCGSAGVILAAHLGIFAMQWHCCARQGAACQQAALQLANAGGKATSAIISAPDRCNPFAQVSRMIF